MIPRAIITSVLLFISSHASISAHASLSSPPLNDLFNQIVSTDFIYKERGKMFGYQTTQSCLFISEKMLILKNYCYPQRNYPARSYTILTPTHGTIHLYEEDFGSQIKREILLKHFPERIVPELFNDLTSESIGHLHQTFKDIYYTYNNPACWVTNLNLSSGQKDAGCYRTEQEDHRSWVDESVAITESPVQWKRIFDSLDQAIYESEHESQRDIPTSISK